MGPDRRKEFLKKNPDLVPTGEEALGVLVVEPKGGAWRRGLREAGGLVGASAAIGESSGAGAGGAAAWPDSKLVWAVLTDKQLHAFEGAVGSGKAGPRAAHYPLEQVATMRLDKKLMISKLYVDFTDGSSLVLDVSKQKVGDFADAMSARFSS